MRRSIAKIKGLGYIVWQTRHMFYHVLVGLVWAWFLRERWGEFNPKWIWTAVVGSVLPDVEHIYYFLGYGKTDSYTQSVMRLLREYRWRELFLFVSTGHKFNTSLAYHNIFTVFGLIGVGLCASVLDWHVGVVLTGAMVSHYVFDMADDIVQLGWINPNWKRWGNGKTR